MAESYIDRKERLKGEGKVELPLNIDSKRYIVGNFSYQDVLVISPMAVLSGILILIFHSNDALSQGSIIGSLAPTVFIGMLQMIKHPVRKNISFLKHNFFWKFQFKRRQKEFHFKKGDIKMSNSTDTRKKIGIKNTYSGCYETTDGSLVKVMEVSSINLSLMNKSEQNYIYSGMRTFINELSTKSIQIEKIAQPVNLSQYLLYIDRQTENEKNNVKNMLKESYKAYVGNIQKARNMVQRKNYIIIRVPISGKKEKALQEIERTQMIMQSKIENMLSGSNRLQVTPLQNEDLIKLLYTCIDYDNAQAQGDHVVGRGSNYMNVSMGESTAKSVLEQFEKKIYESIN